MAEAFQGCFLRFLSFLSVAGTFCSGAFLGLPLPGTSRMVSSADLSYIASLVMGLILATNNRCFAAAGAIPKILAISVSIQTLKEQKMKEHRQDIKYQCGHVKVIYTLGYKPKVDRKKECPTCRYEKLADLHGVSKTVNEYGITIYHTGKTV